jgi:hypothetical protein
MPGMPSEAELQRANAGPGIMKTARFAYDARAPDEHRWPAAGFTTPPFPAASCAEGRRPMCSGDAGATS